MVQYVNTQSLGVLYTQEGIEKMDTRSLYGSKSKFLSVGWEEAGVPDRTRGFGHGFSDPFRPKSLQENLAIFF